MTITLTAITRCAGAGHINLTVFVDGVRRTETFLRSELDLDPTDVREAIITRFRSAIKEAGASTPLQISNALLDKDFKV